MGERASVDPLTIVSLDSHAQVPEDLWASYLEKPYHDLLPRLHDENVKWVEVMRPFFVDRSAALHDAYDHEMVYQTSGIRGMFECDERLAQMDREGIAGEFVYNGDSRIAACFFQCSSKYPDDAVEAGVRAHHRWAHESFGDGSDRIYLVGATGHAPCADMDATLAETRWISDHGFVGTMIPGNTSYAGQPPLHDEYWDPLWSLCAERGLALVVHAGFGHEGGPFFDELAQVYDEMQVAGGLTEALATRLGMAMQDQHFPIFETRRPLWQLTLGGVFDRHPKLKLLLAEIRSDWLPALLRHLDGIFEQHRDELPARRLASEYWQSNCMSCLSFVHKAEIEMREEIGVETIAFGRDYPHPEGTWPNTREWIRDAFAGVPEHEVRMMLGGNAIRHLGLDGERLGRVAQRVGPTFEQLMSAVPQPSTELLRHFDLRGGYLKPPEGAALLDKTGDYIERDLSKLLHPPAVAG